MHLSLLQRLPELSAAMKNSLRELETETKRATGLSRQLLMFSRHQTVQIRPTDLNGLLENLLKMLRRLIGEHITLAFSVGDTPLWIEADPGMIEQVIMNLCVNARDAISPAGGRVTIRAYEVSLDSTLVLGDTESRSGDFVCFSVTDTGCGMDESTQRRLFEPFFTTKEPGKGTGFGLATVYSIVKQHRGWVSVQSTVGKGTVFRIFLPAGAIPTETANKSAAQPAIKGGGEGILVVEDDAGFRTMVVMSLKVLGYRVFEAAEGGAALILWEKHAAEIALLFTDLVMPGGISGLELCTRLHQASPTLGRIISTGYNTDLTNPESLAEAGIDFLPKPFTSEALAHAVRKCLDERESVS
jgi:CheY-like chemotaxis protein